MTVLQTILISETNYLTFIIIPHAYNILNKLVLQFDVKTKLIFLFITLKARIHHKLSYFNKIKTYTNTLMIEGSCKLYYIAFSYNIILF